MKYATNVDDSRGSTVLSRCWVTIPLLFLSSSPYVLFRKEQQRAVYLLLSTSNKGQHSLPHASLINSRLFAIGIGIGIGIGMKQKLVICIKLKVYRVRNMLSTAGAGKMLTYQLFLVKVTLPTPNLFFKICCVL